MINNILFRVQHLLEKTFQMHHWKKLIVFVEILMIILVVHGVTYTMKLMKQLKKNIVIFHFVMTRVNYLIQNKIILILIMEDWYIHHYIISYNINLNCVLDCLVYVRNTSKYSTLTILNSTFTSIKFWMKLWNPNDEYNVCDNVCV